MIPGGLARVLGLTPGVEDQVGSLVSADSDTGTKEDLDLVLIGVGRLHGDEFSLARRCRSMDSGLPCRDIDHFGANPRFHSLVAEVDQPEGSHGKGVGV